METNKILLGSVAIDTVTYINSGKAGRELLQSMPLAMAGEWFGSMRE